MVRHAGLGRRDQWGSWPGWSARLRGRGRSVTCVRRTGLRLSLQELCSECPVGWNDLCEDWGGRHWRAWACISQGEALGGFPESRWWVARDPCGSRGQVAGVREAQSESGWPWGRRRSDHPSPSLTPPARAGVRRVGTGNVGGHWCGGQVSGDREPVWPGGVWMGQWTGRDGTTASWRVTGSVREEPGGQGAVGRGQGHRRPVSAPLPGDPRSPSGLTYRPGAGQVAGP